MESREIQSATVWGDFCLPRLFYPQCDHLLSTEHRIQCN